VQGLFRQGALIHAGNPLMHFPLTTGHVEITVLASLKPANIRGYSGTLIQQLNQSAVDLVYLATQLLKTLILGMGTLPKLQGIYIWDATLVDRPSKATFFACNS